jgi:chromosome segregation ATPase
MPPPDPLPPERLDELEQSLNCPGYMNAGLDVATVRALVAGCRELADLKLDPSKLDFLLARWDQTEPKLQREIVAAFTIRAGKAEAESARLAGEVERLTREGQWNTEAYKGMRKAFHDAEADRDRLRAALAELTLERDELLADVKATELNTLMWAANVAYHHGQKDDFRTLAARIRRGPSPSPEVPHAD